MYIKVNLLPKSYYEVKSAKKLVILFALLLVVLLVVSIFWKIKINESTSAIQKKIDIANNYKKQIDAINLEISNRQAEVAYFQIRVDGIKKVLDFNKTIPGPFLEVAKWTYEKVQYTSLGINGSSVTIEARARSLDDIGRYILNLYKASDTFNPGSISLTIDGMGSGGGTGASGMSGMPGMGGGMPGMSGSSSMPGAMPGAMPSVTPNMTTPSAIASPATGGMGIGMPGAMGMGGMSAGTAGAGSSSAGWIKFRINATLKNPVTAPTFSLTASTPTTSTGMGGMSTGMGGMPGMAGAPGMGSPSAMPGAAGMSSPGGAASRPAGMD